MDEESRIRITGFSTLSLRTRGSGIECELYPGFSAPEQYEANRWQGSWTDVYGIGAVAYHMLTGRYLPPAGERRTGAPLPGLRELPGLPGNMAATIEKRSVPRASTASRVSRNFLPVFCSLSKGIPQSFPSRPTKP